MKLFDYWTENFKKTKDAFDYVMIWVGIISVAAIVVCYIGDFKNPISETFQKLGETGLVAFFVVWCLIWLPFRRHEADKLSHENSVNLLKAELQANVVDLRITAELVLEHTTTIHGLLTVKVLNRGQKEAKIRKVAVLIIPDFAILYGQTDSTEPIEPSEIILNPKPEIIKISGDDGLHEWNQEFLNKPLFVSDEKEGIKYGRGYVELTSERKIPFEFQILPEDSWRVIRGQTFKVN